MKSDICIDKFFNIHDTYWTLFNILDFYSMLENNFTIIMCLFVTACMLVFPAEKLD